MGLWGFKMPILPIVTGAVTAKIPPVVQPAVPVFDWVPLSSPWVAAVKWVPNQGVALRFYQHHHYGPAIFQCVYPGTDMWLYEYFLVAPHPGKVVHQFLFKKWPYQPYAG